ARLVAGIEAAAGEADGVGRPPLAQAPEGVGELDLAAMVWRRLPENGEDVRRQDVPPDDGEVGRRRLGCRLLDQVLHEIHVVGDLGPADDAVQGELARGYAFHREDGLAVALVDGEELADARWVGDDDVVAEEDGEGLVADQGERAQDGVAEAERLLLPDV